MKELKLLTRVDFPRSKVSLSLKDRIVILGSCFADNVGQIASDFGFNLCRNPFGTLYNPVSVCNSVARLSSGVPFEEADCVRMGAGSDLVCSFSHHTSFARKVPSDFLENANRSLAGASEFWKEARKVIVTLGTAWCYQYIRTGEIVSNCLKIDAREFERRCLTVPEVSLLLRNMLAKHPDKEFVFTVSPIRHFKDGAHGNQLSKSTLLLAVDEVCKAFPERTDYFPAYEIVLDELRDYRFYAEDMLHPSRQSVDYLWKRFVEFSVPVEELSQLAENEKEFKRLSHRAVNRE